MLITVVLKLWKEWKHGNRETQITSEEKYPEAKRKAILFMRPYLQKREIDLQKLVGDMI